MLTKEQNVCSAPLRLKLLPTAGIYNLAETKLNWFAELLLTSTTFSSLLITGSFSNPLKRDEVSISEIVLRTLFNPHQKKADISPSMLRNKTNELTFHIVQLF